MKHRIIVVDDEKSIHSSLARTFRGTEYDVEYFLEGQKALEFLKSNSVSIIISDMKMPGMSGIEFLEKSISIAPDAIRIALSGFSDSSVVLEAVNKGFIRHYITKPWETGLLMMDIKNATELIEARYKEKKLIRTLKIKVKQLNDLNSNLEDIVKKKTWIINKRSELLNLFFEEMDSDSIIKESLQIIKEIIGDRDLWVESSFLPQVIATNSGDIPKPLKSVSYKCKEAGIRVIIPQGIGIPLVEKSAYLGTLLLENKTIPDKVLDDIEILSSVISMAIQHKTIIGNPHQLLDHIDKILEDI